jgi:hypothetical protein
MNVRATDPTTSAYAAQSMAASGPAPKKAAAAATAPASSPAATVSLSGGTPASVDSDDRGTYAQVLKAMGGNVGAAMGAVKAADAKEGEG